MKRTTSLLLILLFLFNTGGSYLIFRMQQSEARRESEETINSQKALKDVIVLAFRQNHEEGLVWVRPGKEFTFRGELYDVVKVTSCGNMKYYHCYNDSREKKLIAGYQKSNHSRKEPDKKRKASNNIIFFSQKCLFSRTLYPSCYTYPLYEFYYLSEIPVTPTPPPKA